MAAKPTSTPGWAPTNPAKVIEPSGAQKTNGYDPGFRPPSQWFNWFWELVSDWVQYLSDGQLEGNHSIAGDLAVEGSADVDVDLDVGGSLAVVGNGSIGGLTTLNDVDVTDSLDVTGSATVGGSLDVTGLAVVDGVLTVGDDLALKETPGGSWRSIVHVPTGWDAAAAADSVIVVPPQAQVFTDAEMGIHGWGTWTPVLSVAGATYTYADGWYQRTGNVMHAYFRVAWTGGTASGNLDMTGLPANYATTIRGQSVPFATGDSPVVGQARDNGTAIYFCIFATASIVNFYTTANALQAEYTPGNLSGHICYPVSPI